MSLPRCSSGYSLARAMKQLITERIGLISACLVFTFQKETAYWANNWASILSTTTYTVVVLIFINILYANVKTFVGYSKDEMLLFLLVGQISFYTNWMYSMRNLRELILEVNTGVLDLILTKPIPILFYLTFRRIKLFSTLRDGLPPTLVIVLLINWHNLTISFPNLLAGIIMWILGLTCLHVLQFLATLPVFWLGESKKVLNIVMSIESQGNTLIPLEGFTSSLKFILSSFVPVLIATAFTTSVLLNKSDKNILLIWALLITVLAVVIMNIAWKFALKHYTSASS